MSSPDLRLDGLLGRAGHLLPLPAAALEILRLWRSEESTLDDLTRALASDPQLSARILRFANSSLYDAGKAVRSLERAARVLGMKILELMTLAFSLAEAVPRTSGGGAFDYGRYWRRGLARATSARALAGRSGARAQDEAFLAGLLAEVGQVLLARAGHYEIVLEETAARRRPWPSAEIERELLGLDHLEVGAALLRVWALPGALELAVRHGRNPAGLPQGTDAEVVRLVRVLALADRAAALLTTEGSPESSGALRDLSSLAKDWLELGEPELDELLLALEAPLREAAQLFEVPWPDGRTHQRILAEAREPRGARERGAG